MESSLLFINRKLFSQSRRKFVAYLGISRYMAGHSKWANIKHIKAAKDAEKSALFTRMSRQMRVAIEEGKNASPSKNLALAQAIEQAKKMNMPMASIQQILKSAEKNESIPKKALTVEVKGPGGFIIIIELLSSNLTKTKSELNTFLRKSQSSVSEGVKYLFEQKGVIHATHCSKSCTMEKVLESAIEGGADDVNQTEGEDGKVIYQFFSDPDALTPLRKYLENAGYYVHFAGVEFLPITTVELNEEHSKIAQRLLTNLNEHPDVMAVYDNIR